MTLDKIKPKTIVISYETISNNKNFQNRLAKLLNIGYNKPRFRYGVIETPRIKKGIISDLQIDSENLDKNYAFITYLPYTLNNDDSTIIETEEQINDFCSESKDCKRFTNNLIDIQPVGSLELSEFETDYITGDEAIHEVENLIVRDLKKFEENFLGTVSIKNINTADEPLKYEVTAFVSFYPKIGGKLMSLMEKFTSDVLNIRKMHLDVILEHDLQDYYESLGYKLVETVILKVDPVSHQLISDDTPLEGGVMASQDFSIGIMIKDI
ncbi:hypothetical protein BVG19_g741 [[Candida] boidinii]|nr:hypothetical protein BVG19_g741 [[Candida] boidinii]OWB49251.1 hypothetical protein B5S27_g791 [[Candida] boidinii]